MIADIENTYTEGVNVVNKCKAEAERDNRTALRGPRSPQEEIDEEAAQRQKKHKSDSEHEVSTEDAGPQWGRA